MIESQQMAANRTQTLRSGFTTGTAAAAAAKGATLCLINGHAPASADVQLLTGDWLAIPLHTCKSINKVTAECLVKKDAGDDPDVTHKALIGAQVCLKPGNGAPHVQIKGGKGVGRVTKPGLEVPPGQPAINSGPRKMIRQAVCQALAASDRPFTAEVEIFVPKGEHLARKTLNAKLGIIGGISILGTTGLVKPLSHRAYIATIRSCLSVAAALGIRQVILTTGRRSERFAQHTVKGKPEEAFIQIGDYFQKSLVLADEFDMQEITLAVFFGKACKMALGVPHTHAAKSKLTLTRLADWTQRATQDATLSSHIARANTAREAFNLLKASHPEVIYEVGRRITRSALRFLPRPIPVHSIIFDFDGQVFFDSQRNERQAQ